MYIHRHYPSHLMQMLSYNTAPLILDILCAVEFYGLLKYSNKTVNYYIPLYVGQVGCDDSSNCE